MGWNGIVDITTIHELDAKTKNCTRSITCTETHTILRNHETEKQVSALAATDCMKAEHENHKKAYEIYKNQSKSMWEYWK